MIITGVGSVPFTDQKDAVEYSRKHDIPYLPELTKCGESMQNYLNSTEPLACAPLFSEYSYDIAKLQSVGPVTAMNFKLSEDIATLKIIDHISRNLKYINAKKIILFLDEPVLGQSGLPFVKMWENIFEEFDVIRGVHTCGNMLWDQLFNAKIDIINFDASLYDITKYYTNRTKRIAWGVKSPGDIKDWQSGDLITAPCGLDQYTIEECDEILANLQTIKSSVD
ncbi:MAG: hypothetical protein JSV49_09685 [Thermoplasmata archaeon]|nr:MAG: hypothetical protein JSV49_09685 [Thermoplasmata archaeon]